MANKIDKPTQVQAAGNLPKIIREYIGCVNTQNHDVSIAHMQSPKGWQEPGQTPEFDEYTLVLKGTLKVETKGEVHIVQEGQAIAIEKGEWVRYSTPDEGAEHIAVCLCEVGNVGDNPFKLCLGIRNALDLCPGQFIVTKVIIGKRSLINAQIVVCEVQQCSADC